MKRPLSPGVAILNKGACGSCSHFNVRCDIFAGVLSRSLIVDQANKAAPHAVCQRRRRLRLSICWSQAMQARFRKSTLLWR